MPRVELRGFNNISAPVSISAAAHMVGTTAATLRTWERRYGIGPSRHLGEARKYTPTDILVLRRMRSLREQGVPPADAAAHALEEIPLQLEHASRGAGTPADLALAANNGDLNSVRLMLAQQICRNGLVRTYCDFVEPAFAQLAQRATGDLPGRNPVFLISRVVLDAVADIVQQSDPLAEDHFNAVIVTGSSRFTAGHVIASALYWNGVDARVIVKPPTDLYEAIVEHQKSRHLDFVILIDEQNQEDSLLQQLTSNHVQLVCVAQNPPTIINSQVSWIRSLRAVVAEIQNMM